MNQVVRHKLKLDGSTAVSLAFVIGVQLTKKKNSVSVNDENNDLRAILEPRWKLRAFHFFFYNRKFLWNSTRENKIDARKKLNKI